MNYKHLYSMCLCIALYSFYPCAYTKAFPTLSLFYTSKYRRHNYAMLLASTGDYFLHNNYNLTMGIIAFACSHLCVLQLLGVSHLQMHFKLLLIPSLVLSICAVCIALYVPVHLMWLVLIYAHLLILLAIAAISLVLMYKQNTQNWTHAISNPYLFAIGIILFIVSDILVLIEILEITNLQQIGLSLYWSSLFLKRTALRH